VDWRLKGAIQKALGFVPGGRQIHYGLQRAAGGLADFGRECDIKVDDWRLMMTHLRTAGVAVAGATIVEIGAGRYPTFPMCLYLASAERVYALDRDRLISAELVEDLADRLSNHIPLIADVARRPEPEITALQRAMVTALRRGASLAVATGNVIDYRAPADATATALPAGSIDIVFSNSVLEHMPAAAIEAAFTEALRILRPGGVMFHAVNCGDHYAYVDRSIHQLHYLQYSDEEWERWNNEFLYQNRLRAKEFTRMARAAGFVIDLDASRPHPRRLAELANMTVHPQFSTVYTPDELAITSVDFVARKPA
jgi:SAM-dependent methyltransferase